MQTRRTKTILRTTSKPSPSAHRPPPLAPDIVDDLGLNCPVTCGCTNPCCPALCLLVSPPHPSGNFIPAPVDCARTLVGACPMSPRGREPVGMGTCRFVAGPFEAAPVI